MKYIVSILILLLFFSSLLSLPYWEEDDFLRQDLSKGLSSDFTDGTYEWNPEWQRWSYIHQLFKTCEFIRNMQVSDSMSPDFGGMIEGENAMNVIETDNTQEAIWVWSRYRELTGDTVYDVNVRRAWIYVMVNPAYNEEGGSSDYYRVWNCGLALFAENKYREVTGDSSFYWYADSCIGYTYNHPLPFTGVSGYYERLHPKTTALVAGMLYQYGKENNIPECMDTAIVYGERVISWLEENPWKNINDEVWAMSGGTCIWGICRSVFEDDSARGFAWLSNYLMLQKYMALEGEWSNSWNIWYANGFNFAGRIVNRYRYRLAHHGLTDSLLVQDRDNDGGVPPTRGDPPNGDHSWVSTYMVFMGFEGLMDSIMDNDAGIPHIVSPNPEQIFLPTDTIDVTILCANYGFNPLNNVPFSLSSPFNYNSMTTLEMGAVDTVLCATQWVPPDTGNYSFYATTSLPGDERNVNDTLGIYFRVRAPQMVTGVVKDRVTNAPIKADLSFTVRGDFGHNFSAQTSTDSLTGEYSILLFDTLFSIEVFPEVPYPMTYRDSALVIADTFYGFDFLIDPATLLLVNRDLNGQYSRYYRENLDSLGVTYVDWVVQDQGLPPFAQMDEFGTRTIIWFSGDNTVNTLSPEEQDSLISFLNGGGNLFLTGQNIAEELNGSPLLSNYVRCDFDSNTTENIMLGVGGDPIGGGINIYIIGGEPNNQISQEVLVPLAGADSVFTYIQGGAGAVKYSSGAYKTVLFGFGFEALNAVGTFASRLVVLERVLNWFGISTEVEEENRKLGIKNLELRIFPNPFSHKVNIYVMGAQAHRCTGAQEIKIYDVAGRAVRSLSIPHSKFPIPNYSWDGRDEKGRLLPAGVYFVRVMSGEFEKTKKILKIK
jgi:hypothetical protein